MKFKSLNTLKISYKLLFLWILAFSMAFFAGCGDDSQAEISAPFSTDAVSSSPEETEEGFKLYLETEGEETSILLFDVSNPADAFPKIESDGQNAQYLVVNNQIENIENVTILLENDEKCVLEKSLSFYNGISSVLLSELEKGEYKISLFVKTSQGVFCYASGEQGFFKALSYAKNENLVLNMIDDIEIRSQEELLLNHPFTWITNQKDFSVSGNIAFDGAQTGIMRLVNDEASEISCKAVYCNTPLWDITVTVPFGNFLEERTFNIYANSLNGEKIDCTEAFVDSHEDLQSLIEPETARLVLREGVENLFLHGDFTFDSLVIDKPINLNLSGNIKINGFIGFEIAEKGNVRISLEGEAIGLSEQLLLEAPLCDVEWQGDSAPSFSYAEKFMNVASYNGVATDSLMGGEGSAVLLSGSFTDSENDNKLNFVPNGNCIDLKMGYVDKIDLNDVSHHGEFSEEAKGEVLCKNGVYYYVVTDSQNRTRGYKINVYNEEFKLPVIHINTNGQSINTKDYYVSGSFSLDYNGFADYAELNGLEMGIQGRGHSSWKLAKKSYKIKFQSGQSLFGLEKAKRWVLVANHADHSLIRNQIAYNVGDVLDNMVFIPSAYMVDLFVNGEYYGVYQLSEQLEVNEGRVPGEEDSLEIDTDYFLEFGGEATETYFGDNMFNHELFKWIEIKNPDSDVLTEEQYNYISDYVLQVENAIINGGDYASLLDVPSLVDWFLLYEFGYNIDGIFRRSDFLLKEKGGKLYFCSPWDFDYGFGNMSLDSSQYEEWICLGNAKTDAYNNYIPTNIMDYLLEDEEFIAALKARWETVGDKMLAAALETIEQAEIVIAPSAEENFRKWDIMGTRVQYENVNTAYLETYQEQLDYLKKWVTNRYNWMNFEINSMS